ncbi:response regulator transcription factor [Cyanobium sp. ATX 6A2]|uniref:response regulator transcription factor n=1 Tax=Cyanobium sp. ATX 6A2 TaxID=2823700 RepID=UPI0020CF4B2A|nr:response regulator transcription factor [Cyanobium sp. ATX 6A2]MCP9888365.1 response regulator transcription factor [Cyanobium sp. ATX 6A2]
MDFTPLLAELEANAHRSRELLRGTRLVLCLGNRALLTLLAQQARPSARVLAANTTAQEAVAAVASDKPDMLLISDVLEEGDGIETAIALKARNPDLRVLLLINRQHRLHALRRAIAGDCDGLVLESSFGSGALLAALHVVSGGGIYVDKPLRREFRRGHERGGPRQVLSERELQVLSLVAAGETNGEIGGKLFLSPDTVKTHLSNLLDKLPARDRTHAAVLGLRWGLIDWPEAEPCR